MEYKSVLIVDDDPELPKVLGALLEPLGCKIRFAANGEIALNLFSAEPSDLIISDIRMPHMDGVQLVHSIRKISKVPMILMTGFSEIKETQEAYTLGANGFLPKPFQKAELLKLVKEALYPNKIEENIDQTDQYCSISIDDFISGKSIQFGIYLKLSRTKFVKIADGGEDLSKERIESFKSKGIRYLYVTKEAFSTYVGFNLQLVKLSNNSKAINNEKKLRLIKHTGEILTQKLKFSNLDEEMYAHSQDYLANTVAILSENPETLNLLAVLADYSEDTYTHSIAVSMISVLVAKQLKWISPITLFKIAMGGLFHDIGNKEIPLEILKKTRRELTAAEIKLLETVPTRGLEILGGIKSISGDVIQVAYQHHEDALGRGFPRGLTRHHIHPMARLVAVANEFCDLMMSEEKGTLVNPAEVLRRLHEISGGRLDATILSALGAALKKEK